MNHQSHANYISLTQKIYTFCELKIVEFISVMLIFNTIIILITDVDIESYLKSILSNIMILHIPVLDP